MRGGRALARGAPDMDSLVGMGALAAWTAGTLGTFLPSTFGGATHHLHAGVMILTFVLFGRWLEGGARARASEAVRALLDPFDLFLDKREDEGPGVLRPVQPREPSSSPALGKRQQLSFRTNDFPELRLPFCCWKRLY